MALRARKIFWAFEKRVPDTDRHLSFEPGHSSHSDDVHKGQTCGALDGCCLVTILRARLTANQRRHCRDASSLCPFGEGWARHLEEDYLK